jgi:transketolase
VDGHDAIAIDRAVRESKSITDRPSLICCKTVIGKGSPHKAGSHDAHGAPLGDQEISATRESIGWHHAAFEIPPDVYEGWDARPRGAALESQWDLKFQAYGVAFPAQAKEFQRRLSGALPATWRQVAEQVVQAVVTKAETIATRKASQNSIEALGPILPELLGGSADLAGSNLTLWSGSKGVSRASGGNYIYYGVREFGMCGVMNGITLHGGFIPYGATFLTFSDYARNALRMAALMKIRSIFVFTHDSIGLGEDGPTHQSVEHAASLRLIPNMDVWRPCDTVESTVSWMAAIERSKGPSSLLFSRQNLPYQVRTPEQIQQISRGGYVLADSEGGGPQVILIATGSEVALAMEARTVLASQKIRARVVSMPCTQAFDRQDESYRSSVLPKGLRRVALEAGVTAYWRKYVGLEGGVVGIDTFGESAPAGELFKLFGFTVDNVVKVVREILK